MTDEELQAIWERVEAVGDNWRTWDELHDNAITDIQALLAEVDRLRALAMRWEAVASELGVSIA